MAIQDIDLGTVIENGEDGDVARTAFTKVNENFDDLDTRVTYIESLDIGTVTSVNDVLPVDGNVDLTPSDIGAATAAQGAKADTAVQSDVFATALNQKVDKVEGYQLSQEDYTTEEKNKLAGLESSLFLGVYGSLAELEAAHPTSDRPGEYAFIPAGGNIYMFVWDVDTERWVTIGSGSEAITAEQVKTLYESNPDTNAFTNAEKTKLGGIQAGAQVNVATNISQGTRTDTTVSINSSTGTGATLAPASVVEAGVMTAADKTKLNTTEIFSSSEKNKLVGYPVAPPSDGKSYVLKDGAWIEAQGEPVVISGQVGTAFSGQLAAGNKIPFNEFWSNSNNGITYDSDNRRFYFSKSGVYRVSLTGNNSFGATRILVGLDQDIPTSSNHRGQSYQPTGNSDMSIGSVFQINAGQYITFFIGFGAISNALDNRYTQFSIEKVM